MARDRACVCRRTGCRRASANAKKARLLPPLAVLHASAYIHAPPNALAGSTFVFHRIRRSSGRFWLQTPTACDTCMHWQKRTTRTSDGVTTATTANRARLRTASPPCTPCPLTSNGRSSVRCARPVVVHSSPPPLPCDSLMTPPHSLVWTRTHASPPAHPPRTHSAQQHTPHSRSAEATPRIGCMDPYSMDQ